MTDTYHALPRSERDHLLAVAHLQREDLPSGQDIQRQVKTLRNGERPANNTTYSVLEELEDRGWIAGKTINGKTVGYRLTRGGHQVLEDTADLFRPDYSAGETNA